MILCISHLLLLFLLLLQLCDFPSGSKVAPPGSMQMDHLLMNLQAQVEHIMSSTSPNCQHLPANLLLICSPDFNTCILTNLVFVVGGQEGKCLTSLMLEMPAEAWIRLGMIVDDAKEGQYNSDSNIGILFMIKEKEKKSSELHEVEHPSWDPKVLLAGNSLLYLPYGISLSLLSVMPCEQPTLKTL